MIDEDKMQLGDYILLTDNNEVDKLAVAINNFSEGLHSLQSNHSNNTNNLHLMAYELLNRLFEGCLDSNR